MNAFQSWVIKIEEITLILEIFFFINLNEIEEKILLGYDFNCLRNKIKPFYYTCEKVHLLLLKDSFLGQLCALELLSLGKLLAPSRDLCDLQLRWSILRCFSLCLQGRVQLHTETRVPYTEVLRNSLYIYIYFLLFWLWKLPEFYYFIFIILLFILLFYYIILYFNNIIIIIYISFHNQKSKKHESRKSPIPYYIYRRFNAIVSQLWFCHFELCF